MLRPWVLFPSGAGKFPFIASRGAQEGTLCFLRQLDKNKITRRVEIVLTLEMTYLKLYCDWD